MKQAPHSASGIRFFITEVRINIQRAFNAINWRNVIGPFLILVLMLPLAAVTRVQEPTAARVQPALLQMTDTQPDQVVGFIIQETAQATGVEELATRIGGAITKGSAHYQRLCGRDAGSRRRASGLDPRRALGEPRCASYFQWWADRHFHPDKRLRQGHRRRPGLE